MKLLLIAILFILPVLSFGQQYNYYHFPSKREHDSLELAYKGFKTDTQRLGAYHQFAYYFSASKRDSALFYITQQLQLSRKFGFKLWEADALDNTAFILWRVGNYPEALSRFLAGIKIAEDPAIEKNIWNVETFTTDKDAKTARLIVLAELEFDLSSLYEEAGYSEKERVELFKGEKIAEQSNNKSALAQIYFGLGSYYLTKRNLDSALIAAKKSVAFAEQSGFTVFEGDALNVIGNAYLLKGDFSAAKTGFLKSVKVNTKQYAFASLTHANLGLSNIFLKQHQADSALYYSKKAHQLANITKDLSDAVIVYNSLSSVFKTRNNIDSAYKYQGMALSAKDSLNSADKVKQFQNIGFTEELRIQQLEKEKAALRERVRNYAMVTGLLVFSLIAFILWRNNRKQKHTNLLLNKQKNEIASQRDELENKNRDLEIETALERVRAVAMSMRKPGDLLGIARSLFNELQQLGFIKLRNAIIHTYLEGDYFIDYDYSDFTQGHISRIPYTGNPILEKFVHDIRKTKDAFTEMIIKGNELKRWQAVRDSNNEIPDERLSNSSALCYYIYSVGEASIGVSTFEPITSDKLEILKRFRNVFDLAYRRYVDIASAEAQIRESEIQLALERVRARTMAMHQSAELAETSSLLFQQIKDLGFETWSCGFCIWKENDFAEVWMGAESGLLPPMMLPYKEEPTHKKIYESFIKGDTVHDYIWEGKELQEHYVFLKTIPSIKAALDVLENAGLSLPDKQCYNVGFFKQGYLLIITKEPATELQWLSHRLAAVFEQTYTRFLDLQKAEAQAREAQIEAALERIRARTMAMQHSNELAETAYMLFQQFKELGENPDQVTIGIVNEAEWVIEYWVTMYGSQSNRVYKFSIDEPNVTNRMYKAWQAREKSLLIDLSGQELFDFSNYRQSMGGAAYNPDEKRRFINAAFFSNGIINVQSSVPPSTENTYLLERFANVFEGTYTRFLDLKTAEANAIRAKEDLILLQTEKKRAEDALTKLKATQTKLIQTEKMASLGELTAGIAHEIQNPLNFVNNFSEVSIELLEELKAESEQEKAKRDDQLEAELITDLTQNLQKINHHGKRADSIVKGMLEHSRAGSGVKEPTDINKLADEYLRLSYHGLRAKDKSFNAEIITRFDNQLQKINVVPQDIGRVLINLFNNAFYAVNQKAKTIGAGYKPEVSVTTGEENGQVLLTVKDNGTGMTSAIKEKIMQPFFTTKPTGEGTGLGLSLTYDMVVKGHGGSIQVNSVDGEGSEFIISLPIS